MFGLKFILFSFLLVFRFDEKEIAKALTLCQTLFLAFKEIVMKLRVWMDIKGITGLDLAEKLGVTDGAISRWKDGSRVPRPEQMRMIVKITKGEVGPVDFY
jgi:predicted transcriptional regulator